MHRKATSSPNGIITNSKSLMQLAGSDAPSENILFLYYYYYYIKEK